MAKCKAVGGGNIVVKVSLSTGYPHTSAIKPVFTVGIQGWYILCKYYWGGGGGGKKGKGGEDKGRKILKMPFLGF